MGSNHTCLAVISLDFALKKVESCFPQVFLKEYKQIEKKVIRPIIDDLERFSDDSDDSDEKYIKAMKLMFLEKTIFKNVFFERIILKTYFLRDCVWERRVN